MFYYYIIIINIMDLLKIINIKNYSGLRKADNIIV